MARWMLATCTAGSVSTGGGFSASLAKICIWPLVVTSSHPAAAQ